jgi:hypothetical protein
VHSLTQLSPDPWPRADQLLLLQACLEEGELARKAWKDWSETVNLHMLDPQSTYMLPMLDHNLRRIGISSHPWLGRIKGYHRYVWTRNRRLFGHADKLFTSIRLLVGGDILLIKGAALACQYYPGIGLRAMGDVDFMIKREAAPRVLNHLCASGWKLAHWPRADRLPRRYFFCRHSENVYREDGAEVDVHWHLMENLCGTAPSQMFWDAAVAMTLPGGAEVRALQLTDLLFHACLHGLRWQPSPQLRWIVDSLVLLRKHEEVKWDRLTELADFFRFSLPLGTALQYLALTFPRQARIPEKTIRYLLEREHPREEVIEHQERMELFPRGENYPPNVLAYYRWFRIRSLPAKMGWWREVRSFFQFVTTRWNLSNSWQIFLYFPSRGVRRIYRKALFQIAGRERAVASGLESR